jgi:hypothetical protein
MPHERKLLRFVDGTRSLIALARDLDENGDFLQSVSWAPDWTLRDVWRTNRYNRGPHCMICLDHWCPPGEDLFVGEVLAIVSAMISRLEDPSLEDHLNVPVRAPSSIPFLPPSCAKSG